MMSKLTIDSFLSLDGVVQSPYSSTEDPSGNSQHGGWLAAYLDRDVDRCICDTLTTVDALLLGRRTYEVLAKRWGCIDPDDPLGLTLTLLPKFVVSSSLERAEWHNSQLVRGDVLEEVAKLKCGHYGEIQIQGSAELAQALIANDLIDEYRLWFFPLVLGSGKRLFSNEGVTLTLTLVDTQTTSTGVVINTYQRVGPRKQGLFPVDRIQCDDVANRVQNATNARL